jgi:hypothetical protein
MIPSDLAARLRFLHEASLFETSPPAAGLQRTREIQSQLQDLMPGQRFLATLQRTLPDGTFRALVAGQQLTLSLNSAAKAGDTLELIATSVTPKLILAQLANPDGANLASSARSTLSPTGQLISFLLTGQPAASPTSLAGQQALLNAPPPGGNANAAAGANINANAGTGNASASTNASTLASAATASTASAASTGLSTQLAPLLRQALTQSGLFYEAHQAQWLSGKIDLATLLREPQAQGGQPPAPGQSPTGSSPATTSAQTPATPSGPANTSASAAPAGTARAEGAAAPATNAAAQGVTRNEEAIARINNSASQAADNAQRGPIAERLLPIVHQQLEALATQQYVWHGLAWPGQPFEWIIEDPGSEGHADSDDSDDEWNTSLRLSLPRLGGVEALVRLNANGVTLRLTVDDVGTLDALEAGRDALAAALAAADVPLDGMLIEQRDE